MKTLDPKVEFNLSKKTSLIESLNIDPKRIFDLNETIKELQGPSSITKSFSEDLQLAINAYCYDVNEVVYVTFIMSSARAMAMMIGPEQAYDFVINLNNIKRDA